MFLCNKTLCCYPLSLLVVLVGVLWFQLGGILWADLYTAHFVLPDARLSVQTVTPLWHCEPNTTRATSGSLDNPEPRATDSEGSGDQAPAITQLSTQYRTNCQGVSTGNIWLKDFVTFSLLLNLSVSYLQADCPKDWVWLRATKAEDWAFVSQILFPSHTWQSLCSHPKRLMIKGSGCESTMPRR